MSLKVELDPVKWTRDERQQFLDKGFRVRREGELPCTAFTRPLDYDNDLKRGEIEYIPGWSNYALHGVVIPDGTELRECNFSQNVPNTNAIKGKNLRFVGCNLTNCAIDKSWTLVECNTAQSWLVAEGEKEARQYICASPEQLKADEKPPVNAVLARPF